MQTVNTTKIAFKNHKISAETVMFGMLHSLYVFFDMTHWTTPCSYGLGSETNCR